jgi:ABC-2 type transport system ATP-binding protein
MATDLMNESEVAESLDVPVSPEPAIEIVELSKVYGQVTAVSGLNLVIPKGTIFGLIGPNGAGKTTTLSVVATLLKPTSGSVRVLGFDPVTKPRDVRRVLGYMPDVMGVNERLTVDEYLTFFAHAFRIPKSAWSATVAGLLELVDLSDKRHELVDSLSRGMKQRVSLARALVHDPQVLVLDEPASGLDPQARRELQTLLQELRSMGKTIVISSHILAELEDMCTDVAIIAGGRVMAAGPTKDLAASIGMQRRYRVRMVDGTSKEFPVTTDEDAHQLLKRLIIEEQLSVAECTFVGAGLEDLFMEVIHHGVSNAPSDPHSPLTTADLVTEADREKVEQQ